MEAKKQANDKKHTELQKQQLGELMKPLLGLYASDVAKIAILACIALVNLTLKDKNLKEQFFYLKGHLIVKKQL